MKLYNPFKNEPTASLDATLLIVLITSVLLYPFLIIIVPVISLWIIIKVIYSVIKVIYETS
jgi:hypothetical protein